MSQEDERHPEFNGGFVEAPDEVAEETPRQKRSRLMSDGKTYRDSATHQTAAQTWAIVEQVDATTAQTDAIQAQTAVMERQATASEEIAFQARIGNILSFYSINQELFPDGVRDQLKTLLKIAGAQPDEAESQPDTEPDTAVPPRALRVVTPVNEDDFA